MSYVATVLAKNNNAWSAYEVDLDDAEDIDGVVDVIRAVDEDAATAVLFVEEEDEYLGIVRVDGDGEDARVFLSDGHAVDSFSLAALLVDGVSGDSSGDASGDADDEEDTPLGHESDPVGDGALLADLGTPEPALVRLCTAESVLPGDVIASIAERAGFLDEVESVRA